MKQYIYEIQQFIILHLFILYFKAQEAYNVQLVGLHTMDFIQAAIVSMFDIFKYFPFEIHIPFVFFVYTQFNGAYLINGKLSQWNDCTYFLGVFIFTDFAVSILLWIYLISWVPIFMDLFDFVVPIFMDLLKLT